jgi:hypothetical protein
MANRATPAKTVSGSGRRVAALAGKATKPAPRVKPVAVKNGTPASAKSTPGKGVKKAARASGARKTAPVAKVSKVPKVAPRAAKQRRTATAPTVRIFQLYRDANQLPRCDPEFEPYQMPESVSPSHQYDALNALAASGGPDDAQLSGMLAPDFNDASGISGAELKRWIAANHGYEAYFCNTDTDAEALYHNPWMQAETLRPGFLELVTKIFHAADLPVELLTAIQPSPVFTSVGSCVATHRFWKRYAAFVAKVLAAADERLPSEEKMDLYPPSGDASPGAALPLLLDRLMPVFLCTEGRQCKACRFSFQARHGRTSVHAKLLKEMKDVACRTRSHWLAACWVNYRNVYLASAYGEGWVRKHLRRITPYSLDFAQDAGNIVAQVAAK